MGGFAISQIDVTILGTEVVTAFFCMEGLIGTVLLLVRKSRKGVSLTFTVAVGATIAVTAQPLAVNAAGTIGGPKRFVQNISLPNEDSWTSILIPVAAMLLASLLGAFAIRAG